MPWIVYCTVCDAVVTPPHPNSQAFSMHFHGSRHVEAATLVALGQVGWATQIHFNPWLDSGWSTEADEENSPPELPVCPESQYRERAFDGPGRKEKKP